MSDRTGGKLCEIYALAAPKDGNPGSLLLVVCIENHLYQSKNFWNGNWRSQWQIRVNPDGHGSARVEGTIRVQVHYFEEGNVQLHTQKPIAQSISLSGDAAACAASIVKFISSQETSFQTMVNEQYQVMSDTTFKALRRQLPVTRTKVDWDKIVGYRLGAELKGSMPH